MVPAVKPASGTGQVRNGGGGYGHACSPNDPYLPPARTHSSMEVEVTDTPECLKCTTLASCHSGLRALAPVARPLQLAICEHCVGPRRLSAPGRCPPLIFSFFFFLLLGSTSSLNAKSPPLLFPRPRNETAGYLLNHPIEPPGTSTFGPRYLAQGKTPFFSDVRLSVHLSLLAPPQSLSPHQLYTRTPPVSSVHLPASCNQRRKADAFCQPLLLNNDLPKSPLSVLTNLLFLLTSVKFFNSSHHGRNSPQARYRRRWCLR
jgi:hypothetical protein